MADSKTADAMFPFARLCDEAENSFGVTSVSDGAITRVLCTMGDLRRIRAAHAMLAARLTPSTGSEQA